jgi:pyruvate/2-oxoglutarate dehydrogenase complex dihydrolipoamide dehydrogenase (E3) component
VARHTHDVIILGGGSGGLVVAAGCAQLGLKTALVEKVVRLGGDCLCYGCVPSKSFLKSAAVRQYARDAERFGLPAPGLPPVDLGRVMDRVQGVIDTVAVHDSPQRFEKLGAEVLFATPRFRSPHEIELHDGRLLSARSIVLATGSSPRAVPIPGLAESGYLTSLTVFSQRQLPGRLITIGAGPIGLELSQGYLRLGSKVTVIDIAPQVLPVEDEDMAALVQRRMEAEGATFFLGAKVERVSAPPGSESTAIAPRTVKLRDREGREQAIEGDALLLAVGRQGNTEGLDLENAGVEVQGGFVKTDDRLATSRKNILAVGDCSGGLLFTHVAGAEGSVAVRRTAFRLPARMSYAHVPWVTYTDPEIASVGLNEKRAREAGVEVSVVSAEFRDNDRAQTEGEAEGRIKILLDRRGRIVGTQLGGLHAGELLAPAIQAVRHGAKMGEFLSPIYPYPTLSEIYRKAAGNYYGPKVFNPRVRRLLRFFFHYRGSGPEQ